MQQIHSANSISILCASNGPEQQQIRPEVNPVVCVFLFFSQKLTKQFNGTGMYFTDMTALRDPLRKAHMLPTLLWRTGRGSAAYRAGVLARTSKLTERTCPSR
jgi:hypothetical protein